MVDKLGDVWASRDFPVLVEVARRIDAGKLSTRASDVTPVLGMELETVRLAGRNLERLGMVSVHRTAEDMYFTELTGSGAVASGLHPDGDDAVSRLVDALRQAAEQTTDPAERSRLRKLADGVGGVSREVFAAVMASVITGGMG